MPAPVVSRRRLLALTFGVLLALAAGMLAGPVPPAWMPPCPFHVLTGLHCPGCGSTRALLALLHGEPWRALRQNALSTLALPALLVWAGHAWWRGFRWGAPPPPLPGWVSRAAFVVVMVFFVLRNLPWWPFRLLAPQS